MVGIYRVRGYLVTRVHSNFMVGMTSLIPGVAEEDQLKQAVGTSISYDEYMKKMNHFGIKGRYVCELENLFNFFRKAKVHYCTPSRSEGVQ